MQIMSNGYLYKTAKGMPSSDFFSILLFFYCFTERRQDVILRGVGDNPWHYAIFCFLQLHDDVPSFSSLFLRKRGKRGFYVEHGRKNNDKKQQININH